MQGLRHFQRLDRAGGAVRRALLHEQAAVEQHAYRLDRVQRHAFGASEDAVAQVLR